PARIGFEQNLASDVRRCRNCNAYEAPSTQRGPQSCAQKPDKLPRICVRASSKLHVVGSGRSRPAGTAEGCIAARMRNCLIRPARSGDEPAAYYVCLKTGNHGEDGEALYREDPDALGRIFVGPYLAFEPDLR